MKRITIFLLIYFWISLCFSQSSNDSSDISNSNFDSLLIEFTNSTNDSNTLNIAYNLLKVAKNPGIANSKTMVNTG